MKNTDPDFQPLTYAGGLYDSDTKLNVFTWKAGSTFGLITALTALIYSLFPNTVMIPFMITLFCWVVLPVLIAYPIFKMRIFQGIKGS